MHGLYEFLLNRRFVKSSRQAVPPELYAPSPFRNGTLKAIGIKFSGPVKRKSEGRGRGRSSTEMEQLFSLELAGEILPHSAWALDRLLLHTQRQLFETVYFRTRNGGNASDISLNCGDPARESEVTRAKSDHTTAPELDPASFGLPADFAAFLAASNKIGPRWVSKIRRAADGTSVSFKSSG